MVNTRNDLDRALLRDDRAPVEWRMSDGLTDYAAALAEMDARAAAVAEGRARELVWLVEHPPLYTLGTSAKAADRPVSSLPVHAAGRGGQVTYHGPGQLVVYPLIDLRRAGLGIRDLVTTLEKSVIAYAGTLDIHAETKLRAPGVYVRGAKLASIGIRVRRGASYHGLALNVSLDLAPFRRINPCGYQGLEMTRLADLGGPDDVRQVADAYAPWLIEYLRAARGGG